jgi:phosphate transport system substrate-binding protein
MKQIAIIFTLCLLCLSPINVRAQETLRVLGTGENQEVVRALGKAFETKQAGVTVEVPDSIGSGGGIKALQKGATDLARTGRPLKDTEKSGLTEVLFGKTAVVFATHPSVTGVKNLTGAQIAGIYTGAITNWKEVGGPDAKIYPTSREIGDSARIVLEASMPGFKDLTLVSKEFFSSTEAVKGVEDNAFTIGYVTMAAAKGHALNILKIDDKDPAAKADGTVDYPYLVPFYLVHTDTLLPLAKQFIDFAHSDEGKAVILATGAIAAK